MLRCACQARLGRGWRFCEACGRPVVEAGSGQVARPAGSAPPVPDRVDGVPQPAQGVESACVPVPIPQVAVRSKTEALCLDHLDWRFGLAPVLVGTVMGLPLVWLSPWVVPAGAALGAFWAWRRWRTIRRAITGFSMEWIFEKVIVYGPCALGDRAWWPTGVLYLTDETLKFKPFNHTNEREVSLDPVRLTGVDFPPRVSWPADWRGVLVTSTYGPVFGIMKVFDRSVWEQHLKAAKQKALQPVSQELT
jgi:hypothetical protein